MVDTRVPTSTVSLNNTNFPTWKVQMKMLLMKQGVWRIVEETEDIPDEEDFAAYRKYRDRRDKALASIVLAVDTNLLYLIGTDPKDPVEVWHKLLDQFQKKTWANKLSLRRKLYGLRLKDQEPVQKHIKSMIEIFDELAVIGEAVEEEDRVVHVLASLPESFSMLVTALEACPEVPKLEVVTEKLLNEERKMKEKSVGSYGDHQKTPHDALLVNSFTKSCYYCGKSGHIKKFCQDWKKKQEEDQKESKSEVANFSYVRGLRKGRNADSESSDDEVECIALVSEVSLVSDKWVVDSAATYHMCKNRRQMRNLKRMKVMKRVKVGNGNYVQAKFEGTVKLRIRSGRRTRVFKLSNVLFVPESKYNLLSVAKASQAGKKVQFDQHGCEIIDATTREGLGSGTKAGNLYYVDISSKSEQKREKTGNVSRRDMEKAIASINENNFKQEMMERLNLIEEDRFNINQRLDLVEEDLSSSTIIKEDIDNQNQEDKHEDKMNLSLERVNIIKEDIQEDSEVLLSESDSECSISSKLSQETLKSCEVFQDQKSVRVRRSFKNKVRSFKERCAKMLKKMR